MEVLPVNFRTLHFFGAWDEDEENISTGKLIYKLVIVTLLLYFTAISVIELLNPRDVNDLSECSFLTLTFVVFLCKWANLNFRRNMLLNVLDKFKLELCQPKTPSEVDIIERFARSARNAHYTFFTMTMISGVVLVIKPLATFTGNELKLPFKTYDPFDLSKRKYFILSYTIHAIAEIYGGAIHSSIDALSYGLIILACGQFELCCHRLKTYIKSGSYTKLKKRWVTHHNLVQEIVQAIESYLIGATMIFFFGALLTLCTTVFKVSQADFGSIEFFTNFGYLGVLLCETLFYCAYGNKLEIKSQRISQAAYDSDWMDLSVADRKNILLIMLIGQNGSSISYRGQCSLTLNTFMGIAKTSYAAFNLMRYMSLG